LTRAEYGDLGYNKGEVYKLYLEAATMKGPKTAQIIYEQVVKPLPASERLKLATMILNGIPSLAVADYSEEWTDEDYRDFATASRAYIMHRLAECN